MKKKKIHKEEGEEIKIKEICIWSTACDNRGITRYF